MDFAPDTPGPEAGAPEKGRKWQEIITIARVEFARTGYRAATIRGIAEKAQVSTRTLYDYFTDKLGLFNACIDAGASRFPQPQLRAGEDAHATLRAYVAAVLRHLSAEGSLQLSLMFFRDADACPEIKAVAMRNDERYLLQPLADFLRDAGIEAAAATKLSRLFMSMATSEWQRRILYDEPLLDDAGIEAHAALVTDVFLDGEPLRSALARAAPG
jgi:AcrR family transcriptional regulator